MVEAVAGQLREKNKREDAHPAARLWMSVNVGAFNGKLMYLVFAVNGEFTKTKKGER